MPFPSVPDPIRNKLPNVAPIENVLTSSSRSPSLATLGTKLSEGVSFVGAKLGSFISGTFGGTSGAPTVPGTSGTSTVSASQVNQETGSSNTEKDTSHLVSLTSTMNSEEAVLFIVMPQIIENRSAEYEAVSPIQFPGSFQKYKGTASTRWTITATLVARTTTEASRNLKDINILRGWLMPFFGENTKLKHPDKIGAPPPVLKFKGFRGSGTIGEVPVVLTSLNWDWPRDVDYIPAVSPGSAADGGGVQNIPFPVVMQITIEVVEAFSTTQWNNFDRDAYVIGNMNGAFNNIAKDKEYGLGNEARHSLEPEAQIAMGNEARHSLASKVTRVEIGNTHGGVPRYSDIPKPGPAGRGIPPAGAVNANTQVVQTVTARTYGGRGQPSKGVK